MRKGGEKLGSILQRLFTESIIGTPLLSVEQHAWEMIREAGGSPSFMTVEGYKWATCLCVNDEVVHGVPSKYILKDGDIFTIDIGMIYGGFHVDTAWTKIIGNPKGKNGDNKQNFLQSGQTALTHAIDQARIGKRIGHISQAIENSIEGAGYSIVKSLVGHGVGRQLHEEPQIPGFLSSSIDSTPKLSEGMTIAIEVIYAQKNGAVNYDNADGWTISTKDGSIAAVFEHTVAITEKGPFILTKAGL
jgi:methionyl aminopeptidase